MCVAASRRWRHFRFALLAVTVLIYSIPFTPAFAQANYPTRSIRVVVPFPAGGTTDMLARLITQKMGESMGQSFVVENVGGAGGSLGAEQIARAAPDGYSLL